MFRKESFEIFDIEGLEMRMQGVRAEIQPIFMDIGEQLKERVKQSFPEQEFYLHIAQHRRRTSNLCSKNEFEDCFTQGFCSI